jgi:NAD(P)-dependent dehydrogenase (short-subunit alcohol dehydrogenase family)
MSTTPWKGATAIITGGGSGIGRALALAMAARGTRILVTDINGEAAQRVATECGAGASATALDVRDADAVRICIEQFAQQQGRLDFLFNNAGIGLAGEAHEIPLAGWRHIVDINVFGVVHGVLAAYPIMLKQGSGHIINTASLAGLGPAPLLTPYGLTKHAVVGLTTSLRIEAAPHGVRVSALCPAAIETPILDTKAPDDMPMPWIPDVRRFLTSLAGPPYPVAKCAEETLAAVAKNVPLIVLPARARAAWRLGRMFPALVEKVTAAAVAKERKTRT